MKVYLKLVSVLLILVLLFMGVGVFCVSAEDTYTKPEKFVYGDVDMDSVVTVKDATLVQKGVAGITYVTAVQRYLADPADEGFNVKNATAIQKYLAGHEVESAIGEELDMSSQDEFSGAVWDTGYYFGESVLITPKDMDYEYTLEDFPEYKFSKIEKHEFVSSKYVYYILYLIEPGKENALEAVKALDYRANIDLEAVELDYYAVAT